MTGVPTWLAAAPQAPGNAGMINQFHGYHNAVFLGAQGALQSNQSTGTGIFQATNTSWLATTFQMGLTQTTIGVVKLALATVGGSPTLPLIPPMTVSLYTDNLGAPGTLVSSTTLNNEYVYTSSFWVSVPLAVTGLSSSANYWIVISTVGSASHYYTWQQSTQGIGASTSPDGVTWTSQSYGLMYQVYDFTGSPTNGQPSFIVEDNGARWTLITYNSNSLPATIAEYTTGQNGTYVYQTRTLSYTQGLLTGIS